MARPGADERGLRRGNRLLVRHAGVSLPARAEGRREHAVAPDFREAGHAPGGDERIRICFGPLAYRGVGDHCGGMARAQNGGSEVKPFPRERFSSDVTLTPAGVSAYASAAGDTNPVHHDAGFAAGTRYGRPIASGTYTTALLLGLTASHYSRAAAM